MRLISLQSGSNGNCLYLEVGSLKLLFDAGISGKLAEKRLAQRGRILGRFRADGTVGGAAMSGGVARVARPAKADGIGRAGSVTSNSTEQCIVADGIFISHDHRDHVGAAGVLHRRLRAPVYATEGTWEAARRRCRLGRVDRLELFRPGDRVTLAGSVTVESYRTPHDGNDGVAYVVDDGCHRLGIFTDLGHVWLGLAEVLSTLDGLFIESNYDVEMLAAGPYPPFLKRRIEGPGGHIANCEAAALVARVWHEGRGRLQWVCLGHLSEENNTAALAVQAHRQLLPDELPIHVASRYGVSAELVLS